jgi:hypothetical protein
MWGLIGLGLAAGGTAANIMAANKEKSSIKKATRRNATGATMQDAARTMWQKRLLEGRQTELDAQGKESRDSFASLIQRMTGSPEDAQAAVASDKAEREAAIGPRATFGADEFGQVAGASKAKTDRLDQTADASADAAAAFSKMGRQDATMAAQNNLGDTLRGILQGRSAQDFQKKQMEEAALMELILPLIGGPGGTGAGAGANLQLLGGLLGMGSSAAFGYGAMAPTGGAGGAWGASEPGLNPYAGVPVQ